MATIEELRQKYGTIGGGSDLPPLSPLPSDNNGGIDALRKKYGVIGSVARTPTKPLETSQGLYNLAVQSGLQGRADDILKQQQGEETKKFFSGGFISDIFDVTNALQYGVVGVLKGKSFYEGVRTRQSFSDEDALGDYGLPGVIAGVALDIAVDPLTYIAPWTILKKIPGVEKGVKVAKEAAFGKNIIREIPDAERNLTKLLPDVEGGTRLGKYLAQKFSWTAQFGGDKIYRETWERGIRNTFVGVKNIAGIPRGVVDLGEEANKALTLIAPEFEGGVTRIKRLKDDELLKLFGDGKEYQTIKLANNTIDELGAEQVKLGLLGKETFEKNFEEYIGNAYMKYELPKAAKFSSAKVGIKGGKARVAELTQEAAEEAGQIKNAGYLYMKTIISMKKDIETAKLLNEINAIAGFTHKADGLIQLPKASRLITTGGKQAEIKAGIGKINEELKPFFNNLKTTSKADRKVLSEIHAMERQIGELSGLRSEEFYKYFQEGDIISKVAPGYKSLKGAYRLSENLQALGIKAEKFENLQALKNSDAGLELEKIYLSGELERSGFSSMEKFFRYVKNPYNKVETTVKETVAVGNLKKLIDLQKNIEKLGRQATNLSELDKRSINDSFRSLEKNINDLRFGKEDLVEELATEKMANLAGKFVPEPMAKLIMDLVEPPKWGVGKEMVAEFKFFKVIMNPGTHARNVVSNTLLNWWKLGIGPWRVDKYLSSVNDLLTKNEWFQRAEQQGMGLGGFSNELKDLLNTPEAAQWGGKFGSNWRKMQDWFGNIYQQEENIAKLTAFKDMIKRELSDEEAWKAAESATFNYAQVTPFIRKLRESFFGFPFITFTVKATPVVLETALKAPHRIGAIGKIKQGIENLSDIHVTDKERASEPPWVREGFYIKLPMTDKYGRSAYFDMTYILPFGDLLAGNFFERHIERETGIKETFPLSAAKKSPFISLVTELGKNKDFYGNSIWKESDSTEKQTADIMRHLSKTMLPPLVADEIPGGYNQKGERQQKGFRGAIGQASEENQKRTMMQEMLRSVGSKIQPIDADIQEGFQEFNKKKQMQTLLVENGVLNNLNIKYVPKK